MQIGTKILIERMNTHPEEFENGVLSKWARIMDMAHDFLPDEDKAAIKEAHNKAKIDYFNGEVLATLAGEREQLGTADNTIRYKAEGRYTFSSPAIKAEGQPLQHSTTTMVNPWATKDEMNAMYNPAQGRPV